MDANRCLKANSAQIVFSLTFFDDFCTILHESHQSQFILATYKNLHFSAKTDCFYLRMDANRCLKANSAQIVFSSTNFGAFCTILHESHQSYFISATYNILHFSAKTDCFQLRMDANRCLKANSAQIVFSLTIFDDFCTILHESHQSQFILATYKNLHFSAKTDCFQLRMDANRCLKANSAQIVFSSTNFGAFCTILHESHQSQFILATYNILHFSAKTDCFQLRMDANRCLKANSAQIVFSLTFFDDFCTILHESHQSQFILATYKNLHFSAKTDCFYLRMDANRCLKANSAQIVFSSTNFGAFCTILHESDQSYFILATYNILHFSAKTDCFQLRMDANRCLKANSAPIVFSSTNFGAFCTILHESHQSQFILATYKNLHFSAKTDCFQLRMDANRCLKANSAQIVFSSTNFGAFCTILHESHQSQFILATYNILHFSAKTDCFQLRMDANRCLKANSAQIVFSLTIFDDFCTILHESHQSQFILATYNNLHFSA